MDKREGRAVEIAIELAFAMGVVSERKGGVNSDLSVFEKFIEDNLTVLKGGDLL